MSSTSLSSAPLSNPNFRKVSSTTNLVNRFEIGPVFRGMRRSKVGVAMVSLQIAFSMAAIVNCYSIVTQIFQPINQDPGIDVDNIVHISNVGIGDRFNPRLATDEDLRYIHSLPGVLSATQIQAIPLSGSGWSSGLRTDVESHDAIVGAVYHVNENVLDTFGAELVSGDSFTVDDVVWVGNNGTEVPASAILTVELAKELFPDLEPVNVVGQVVYQGNDLHTIKGVIASFPRPWISTTANNRSFLIPRQNDTSSYHYAIRVEPGSSDQLMSELEEGLMKLNRDRVLRNISTIAETARNLNAGNIVASGILVIITIVFVLVTCLGLIGLVNLNIKQRIKQIGVRRALGANQQDIVRYFLIESLVICTLGVVLGTGLAIGLNVLLVSVLEMIKVSWWVFAVTASGLLLLCLFATAIPSYRAAQVSPAIATRAV